MQEIGGRYRQYKKDTNIFLNWLFAEAAQRQPSYTQAESVQRVSEQAPHKSAKARKKARQRQTKREQADLSADSLICSDGEICEPRVPVQQIRDAARDVIKKGRHLPQHIEAVLRRTIEGRQGFSRYFRGASECEPEGEVAVDSHAHFIAVLQECLELLRLPGVSRRPALQNSHNDEAYRSLHSRLCRAMSP